MNIASRPPGTFEKSKNKSRWFNLYEAKKLLSFYRQ